MRNQVQTRKGEVIDDQGWIQQVIYTDYINYIPAPPPGKAPQKQLATKAARKGWPSSTRGLMLKKCGCCNEKGLEGCKAKCQ